jgi:hypothetical protein
MNNAHQTAMYLPGLLCVSLLVFPFWGFCEDIRNCEYKSNSDARYLCTAVAMANPVICDQISTQDGISNCRAMTSKNSYECDRIPSSSKRQYCLMGVRDFQRDSIWAIKRMN